MDSDQIFRMTNAIEQAIAFGIHAGSVEVSKRLPSIDERMTHLVVMAAATIAAVQHTTLHGADFYPDVYAAKEIVMIAMSQQDPPPVDVFGMVTIWGDHIAGEWKGDGIPF